MTPLRHHTRHLLGQGCVHVDDGSPTRPPPRPAEGILMQELFDGRALKLIRERVKRLIGRHGFTASDRDDLEQEFI